MPNPLLHQPKTCHPERSEGSAFLRENADSSPRAKAAQLGMTLALFLVRVYQQFVAPLMPLGCRYYPTCSHYTAEAIARHGVRRGVWLGALRILRCHPFAHGGFDRVPDGGDENWRVSVRHKPADGTRRYRGEEPAR